MRKGLLYSVQLLLYYINGLKSTTLSVTVLIFQGA